MSYMGPPPGTAVEIRWPYSDAGQHVIERGVIIHAAMTWVLAYFPGLPEEPANPWDAGAIRVVPTGDVTAYRELVDCDPAWVLDTWKHLEKAGIGLLQAPHAVRVWQLAAALAQHQLDAPVTQLITRGQLESWAGRPLTEDDLAELHESASGMEECGVLGAIVGAIVAAIDARNEN